MNRKRITAILAAILVWVGGPAGGQTAGDDRDRTKNAEARGLHPYEAVAPREAKAAIVQELYERLVAVPFVPDAVLAAEIDRGLSGKAFGKALGVSERQGRRRQQALIAALRQIQDEGYSDQEIGAALERVAKREVNSMHREAAAGILYSMSDRTFNACCWLLGEKNWAWSERKPADLKQCMSEVHAIHERLLSEHIPLDVAACVMKERVADELESRRQAFMLEHREELNLAGVTAVFKAELAVLRKSNGTKHARRIKRYEGIIRSLDAQVRSKTTVIAEWAVDGKIDSRLVDFVQQAQRRACIEPTWRAEQILERAWKGRENPTKFRGVLETLLRRSELRALPKRMGRLGRR